MMMDITPTVGLMFLMGFTGSLHCIGMCGGLITAVSIHQKQAYWLGLLAYQFGRISTYTILGIIIGLAGIALHSLNHNSIQLSLTIFAGLLMMVFGFNLAGWLPDPLQRFTSWTIKKTRLMPFIMQLSKHARLHGWYTLGLVNGLLPCGLVYAALSMSLTTESMLDASMMMISFGLGTIPAMMFVPSILQKMSPMLRLTSLRIAAILIIILGMMTIFRGIMPMHSM